MGEERNRKRQSDAMYLLLDTGIFDDDFIEDRRKGLEEFVNK